MDSVKKLFNLLLFIAPQKSEAIIWLQGDRYNRGLKVLELYNSGWAKKIVLTGNNVLLNSKLRPGEKNVSLRSMSNWLTKRGVKKGDIIFESESLNTRDQAKNVIVLAKKKKWSSILLVGSSYYQPRAFLTFLFFSARFGWNGLINNQPFFVEENKIPGGRSEKAKRLFLKERVKIDLYTKDLSSLKNGIKYVEDNFIRIKLKPAKFCDVKFLFDLRNDPTTRSNSFSQEKIKMSEHVNWFKKVSASKNIFIYIVFNEFKKKIGQVRFEVSKGQAEISIAISKNFRNRGYGLEVVSVSSMFFLDKFPLVKSILARIKKSNVASVGVFEKAGYKILKEKKGVLLLYFNSL